jgi:hypothetical protein
MKSSPYNKFIDDDETLNYFKVDNFYDDERIKGYYTTPKKILEAYKATEHFEPLNHVNMTYLVCDKDRLGYKRSKTVIQRRMFLVKKLDAIYNSERPFTPEELEIAKNEFLKVDDRETQEETKHTIAAYEKIGSEAIKNVCYSKTKIDRLIKESNKESDINKMYSKRVREAIKKRFPENAEYKKEDLLNGVLEVFRNNGVKAKVNINTIRKYYGADELNGKRIGFVKLFLFQPDFEYD